MIVIKYFGPQDRRLPSAVPYRDGLTIEDLLDSIKEVLYETTGFNAEQFTFMVNRLPADESTLLCDGDELYLFQPVFGG